MRRYLLVFGLLFFTSCSVGMALHGKPEPNVGALTIGQDRDIVLLNLGQPEQTYFTEDKKVDVFEIQKGNAPSGGRALGHGAMDVLTLGLWEIIGTPIEATIGSKQMLTIEYDENEKVTKIFSGVPQEGL